MGVAGNQSIFPEVLQKIFLDQNAVNIRTRSTFMLYHE